MEPWMQLAIPITIGLIFSLIAAIWKTNQRVNETHAIKIDALESDVNMAIQMARGHDLALAGIKETCKARERTNVGENRIQAIFREELKEFEKRMKTEITTSIKLSLLEDGYIKPAPATRKRNVAKS